MAKTLLETLRGSVRPVVTYAMAAALIAGFFTGRVPADSFLGVATAVTLFWFTSRPKQNGEG